MTQYRMSQYRMAQYRMAQYGLIAAFSFGFVGLPASVQANPVPFDPSIMCIESKIEQLNQTQEGMQKLAGRSALQLGDECGKEHGWTLRKTTASSFYTVSNILLKAERANWANSGFAADLPDRIQKRIKLVQLNELLLLGRSATFQKALAEELAATGSTLNADDSIDKLSMPESNAVGEKIGRLIMALFTRDEAIKFYNDPTYQSPDFFTLYNAIDPRSAELLAGLK